MHLAGRMTLEGFLEKHKDGFVMPDYHGGFHWHIFNVLRYGFPFESKSNDFGRFILNGNRIVDGYQRLVVIAMHLKAFSAISPEFFSSIIRAENFFSRQAWKVVNRAGNGLLVNELEKVLKAKLTVYELDDYDDEDTGNSRQEKPEIQRSERIPIPIITWKSIHTGSQIILTLQPQMTISSGF